MKVAFTLQPPADRRPRDRKRSRVRQRGDGERDRRRDRGRRPRGREGRGLGPGLEPARATRGDRSGHHLQHRRGPDRGRMREAFYPALFEELGIPYTGSRRVHERDHARQVADQAARRSAPASTRRAACSSPCATSSSIVERGAGLAFPVIVKPNHEGSSKGIYNGALGSARSSRSRGSSPSALKSRAARVPRRRAGRGVHRGPRRRGRLHRGRRPRRRPADAGRARCSSRAARRARPFNIYDYRLKNVEPGKVQYRCPANLPRDVAARLRAISIEAIRTLGLRDIARLDFRVTPEGRIYLLEANALPSLASQLVAVRGDRAGRPDLQRDDRRRS